MSNKSKNLCNDKDYCHPMNSECVIIDQLQKVELGIYDLKKQIDILEKQVEFIKGLIQCQWVKIDWENRVIIGKSGTKYKILPEKISVGRWPKYELWSALIATRLDMDTFVRTLNEILRKVEKAQTFGDMIAPYSELRDLRSGIVRYAGNRQTAISWICGIILS